jgi:hypothetical protein
LLTVTNESPSPKVIKPDERVGILLVHGIGEQCQFEHLLEICRHVSRTLTIDVSQGRLETQILVKTKPEGAYASKAQTWSAHKAPITIRTRNRVGFITDIEFHEVWWADLGEPSTFATVLDFWFWGTSLWSRQRYIENLQVDNKGRMRLPSATPNKNGSPQPPKLGFIGRLILFGLSWVALIIMPVIAIINRTLSVIGLRIARLDTISQYLSRTKIFSQQERKSVGPITDADHPPRIGIRRRMVQAMVKMALLNYDRWYVLAHSQGTILAFNSLMETEQNLPNYLDQNLWHRAIKKLYKKAENEEQLAQGRMRPHRPDWLNPEDLIDRKKLFANLRGVMTYGSPLSKFARLWPAIVQLNKDECVFNKDFEWINIYDPTDPVAGPVEPFFQPSASKTDLKTSGKIPPTPKDYAYKAKFLHLLSHIHYLTPEPQRKDYRLVNELVRWIISGKKFNEQNRLNTISPKKLFLYDFIRILFWWLAGFICTVILGFSINLLPYIKDFSAQGIALNIINTLNLPIPHVLIGLAEHIINGILCGAVGMIIIFFLGAIGAIREHLVVRDINRIKKNLLELLNPYENKAYDISEIYEKSDIYEIYGIYKDKYDISEMYKDTYDISEIKDKFSTYDKKLIIKALNKMVEERTIKQLSNGKYVFPTTTFILSPNILEDDNSRNIMSRYKKIICDALDNQLSYAPDEEDDCRIRIENNNWLMNIKSGDASIYLYYVVDNPQDEELKKRIVITKIEVEDVKN